MTRGKGRRELKRHQASPHVRLSIACCSRAGVQKPDRRSPLRRKGRETQVTSVLRPIIRGPVLMPNRGNCGYFREFRQNVWANSLVVGLCGGERWIRTQSTALTEQVTNCS